MDFFENIGERKIIILSTTTKDWSKDEIIYSNTCLDKIRSDIKAAGFKSKMLIVKSSADLKNKLQKLDQNKVVIFNWVEEIDNLKYGYHIAPRILENMGFIYTGNNSRTLTNTNDKIAIKKTLLRNKISTPLYTTIKKGFTHLNNWNTYPCIVKPAHEHCSYGITRRSVVDNEKQLKARAETLFSRYGQPLLIEEFIDGPEFFVSSWGYDNPEILPLVCQDYSYTKDYHHQIYDYIAKWRDKTKISHRCSSRLPAEKTTNIPESIYIEVANAIRSTGCLSYCRVDVRVRNNIPYIIDINPNPDISIQGDFVIATSRLGYNYGQTILKLCDLAIKNYIDNTNKTYKYTKPMFPPAVPNFATITA